MKTIEYKQEIMKFNEYPAMIRSEIITSNSPLYIWRCRCDIFRCDGAPLVDILVDATDLLDSENVYRISFLEAEFAEEFYLYISDLIDSKIPELDESIYQSLQKKTQEYITVIRYDFNNGINIP